MATFISRALVLAVTLNTPPLVTSLTTSHLGKNVDPTLDAPKPMLQGIARHAQEDRTSTVSQFGITAPQEKEKKGGPTFEEYVGKLLTTNVCAKPKSCAKEGGDAYTKCKSKCIAFHASPSCKSKTEEAFVTKVTQCKECKECLESHGCETLGVCNCWK